MTDDDEPFLINAASRSAAYRRRTIPGNDEAKLNDSEQADGLLNTGSSLRRRFRRRTDVKNDETKSGDSEEKGDDADAEPAAEESKDASPHTPSLRFQRATSVTQPATPNAASRLHRSSMPMLHHSNYIRRPPDEKLKEKFKSKLRDVADGIPEVHFIGEVVEGVGFKDSFVACKWYLEWGKAWSFLEGEESSQTQYASSDDGIQVWNHPIDVHFASASIQGWPRMVVQVWELDEFGRSVLSGYGFVHLPTNPGYHEVEVRCWRPSGSLKEELESFFLGTSTCLVDEDIVFGKAWEKRSQLMTVSSGTVKLHVTVILMFFNDQKVA